MTRSPWSNDPEQVQGALDTDMYNVLAGLAQNKTGSQYRNNYMQNYYQQFPRPEQNGTQVSLDNLTQPVSNSSETLIESVIENDLESKKILDKNLYRDLYYEDQVIHSEEKKRPRLNYALYMLTTRRPKPNGPATAVYSPSKTTASYQASPYSYQLQNSSQNNQYNSTAYVGVVGQQSASIERNMSANSTDALTKGTTSPEYSAESQGTRNSSQTNAVENKSVSSQNDTTMTDSSYERYKQYFKEYYSRLQNSSRAANETQLNASSSVEDSPSSKNSSYNVQFSQDHTESSTEQLKILNTSSLLADQLKSPSSKAGITDQVATYATSEEPPEDDDTDYIDQLDITALVRELIKLETIRKERKLAKKKHLEREHSREVTGLLAGDLMRGYFKTKNGQPQKGLKKHLLRNAKRPVKSKFNHSPLPKFSRSKISS